MNADLMHARACKYAEHKSPEMLDLAIESSLPLCAYIANKFKGRGIEYEDLFQVASMALVQALDSFDPLRGLRFTTYVTPTLTGKVRNYIRDKVDLVRPPRAIKEQITKLTNVQNHLSQTLYREPTVKELAHSLSWSLDQVINTLDNKEKVRVSSLDEPLEDGQMPSEQLGKEELGFEQFEIRTDLQNALHHISEQQRVVLHHRYIEKISQREVAKLLGISQMQVSRLERKGLTALKEHMD